MSRRGFLGLRWCLAVAPTLALVASAGPAVGQPMEIVAFGDSITTGFGDDDVTCPISDVGGYPRRLQSRLRAMGFDVFVKNFGLCGETTAGALTRIDDVLALGGEIFLLMEGTNDVSAPFISIPTIRDNLDALVEKAVARGLEPIRSTVIPRDPTDQGNVETEALANLIVEAADRDGQVLADPFHAWIGIPDLFTLYYFDTLHPNAAGYAGLGDFMVAPTREAIGRYESSCRTGSKNLCLRDERFQISVTWRDFQNRTGVGRAIPLTTDTGSFWFFNPDNIELVLKVLDGRPNNGHYWVFYGSLSNVEYTITVTDTLTGAVEQYHNALGDFGSVGDTTAFPGELEPLGGPIESEVQGDRDAGWVAFPWPSDDADGAAADGAVAKGEGACVEDATHLCLNDGRFRVSAVWRDFRDRTGVGMAIPRTPDTGNFWFFRDANIELIVKVLDGRPNNGHFWVFYGALSNVEYTITVEDTMTGAVKEYRNEIGDFGSVGDTRAFPADS